MPPQAVLLTFLVRPNGAELVDAVTADHIRLYLAFSGTGPDTPAG